MLRETHWIGLFTYYGMIGELNQMMENNISAQRITSGNFQLVMPFMVLI
jgi:hypothetical protein